MQIAGAEELLNLDFDGACLNPGGIELVTLLKCPSAHLLVIPQVRLQAHTNDRLYESNDSRDIENGSFSLSKLR